MNYLYKKNIFEIWEGVVNTNGWFDTQWPIIDNTTYHTNCRVAKQRAVFEMNLMKLFLIYRSNVKVTVMMQVEKANTNGKQSVYCNLQRVSTVHDWESYKIKDVFDDGTMTFFWYIYALRTLSINLFICIFKLYIIVFHALLILKS